MPTIPENILVILGAILFAVGFWLLVRKFWPEERRRTHNEITGWQVSVLGTTYAVIVGFMLFAAWADFRIAKQNADGESSNLIDLYWSASGLPQAQRQQIRKLAGDYADAAINDEWPAMRAGGISHAGTDVIEKLWVAASQTQSLTASEQVSLQQTTQEISNITEHRRLRQLQSQTTLPGILWLLLMIGGLITVMSACLFGSENHVLHLLQVVSLSLLLSFVLVAIADINRPFRGYMGINPTGFEIAKQTFAAHGGKQAGQ